MSRNLCKNHCNECPGKNEHIVLLESPRPITKEEAGKYWNEFRYLVVAKAQCVLCHTLYLAWVHYPNYYDWQPYPDERFLDLSYQHSFNDEPAPKDLPLYEVEEVISYKRTIRKDHPYLEHASPEEKASYQDRINSLMPDLILDKK